jgi:hypothetical protein
VRWFEGGLTLEALLNYPVDFIGEIIEAHRKLQARENAEIEKAKNRR